MKKVFLILILLLSAQLGAQGIIKHTALAGNTDGHITTINSSLTNNKSDAILIVTQNYGVYNNNEIGVLYSQGKWKIFNQNRRKIPLNARFNVLVLPSSGANAFVHTTTAANTSAHISRLNSALTNAKPDALIYITQQFGLYNTSNVGVYYTNNGWAVFNEKTNKKMPIGTLFNVLVLNPGKNRIGNSDLYAFKYTNSSSGHISVVPSPVPMAKNATIFATQHWKNVYNPNVTGVWHNGSKWTVYNQNKRTLPMGVQFNILATNYTSQMIRVDRPVAIAGRQVAEPMAKIPRNVTRQNFASKFELTTAQKNYLRTHSIEKNKLVRFYSNNQTKNGERFTKLAVEALTKDQYVNIEEAYIETPTEETAVDDEAEVIDDPEPDGEEVVYDDSIEGYIPYPIVLSTSDTVQIKFGTTSSDQVNANQIVSKLLIEGLRYAIEVANDTLPADDKIRSIYVMATTNGEHGTNSNHYSGSAVDISRINDTKMFLSGVTYSIIQLQMAFDDFEYVRENFGPAFKHKYTIENDTWNHNFPVGGHQTHIHFSVRK